MTFLTNKNGKGCRDSLAAAVPGTQSDEIIAILVNVMCKSERRRVISEKNERDKSIPPFTYPNGG